MNPNEPIVYWQVTSAGWESESGFVIVETPVSLTVNGEGWLSFMCTPVHLEAMAVGFLFNEGLIESRSEIADVRVCAKGDNVDVWLTHSVEKPARWTRTSGCTGGVTSIESEASQETASAASEILDTTAETPAVRPLLPHLVNGTTLHPQQVTTLIQLVLEAQDLYRQSGGVHTSALSDGQRLLVVAEDIGRHNTLDKIAGRCLLEDIQPMRRILLTTGRVSSEMLQKAARLGAAVVISRTAPSSLAIDLAERGGITLIGYARRDRFNVYTHPHRILSSPAEAHRPVPDDSAESSPKEL